MLNRLCFLQNSQDHWTVIDLVKGTVESRTRGLYRSVQKVVHQENTYRVVFTCVPNFETDVVDDNTYITCQLLDKAVEQKAMEQKAMEQKAMEQKAMEQKAMDQKAMDQKAMEQKAISRESWLFAELIVSFSGVLALLYWSHTSSSLASYSVIDNP